MADDGVDLDGINRLRALFSESMGTPPPGVGDSAHREALATGRNVNAPARHASVSISPGKTGDPLWYFKRSSVPFNIWSDPQGIEIQKVRALCRILYATHPLIGAAIDVYSSYPLSGMEATCADDKRIGDFYNDVFFDSEFDYHSHLLDIGREFWLAGEGISLGNFDPHLGIWVSEEPLNPDDVRVIRTPLTDNYRFEIDLPPSVRETLMRRGTPEYIALIDKYPELSQYQLSSWPSVQDIDAYKNPDRPMIPVADELISYIRHQGDTFHQRGVPILMRAIRPVTQQEMLHAAQDSIAQRLYTPLLLARLGASAQDLGTTMPWIPSPADLNQFTADIEAALAADFRMIVSNFTADIRNVFGRDTMPNLDRDFERLDESILQAFGMSKTMLSGASGGQTYAADAMNRDLVSQKLTIYQNKVKRVWKQRARVVAEAQGHFAYRKNGGHPIPEMEDQIEIDYETGERRVVQKPKLVDVELRIRAMNLQDEDKYQGFLDSLRQSGTPISEQTRVANYPIDIESEAQAVADEEVRKAILQQETRRRIYVDLNRKGLPVPQDLIDDFQPKAVSGPDSTADAASEVTLDETDQFNQIPILGRDPVADTSILSPPTEIDRVPGAVETDNADDPDDPANRLRPDSKIPTRPPESDEMRADMPKKSMMALASEMNLDVDDEDDALEAIGGLTGETLKGLKLLPEGVRMGSLQVSHIGQADRSWFYLNHLGDGDE